MSKPEFAHLHLHSEHSPLDGACRMDRLMERVKVLGMEHVGLTDHGTMSGLLKFQKAADAAGVKPILGVEVYFTEDRFVKDPLNRYYHLTLLAETTKGYENLCKMNSIGNREGFYYKPRVDYELLKKYGEGVIVLTGCMASRTMQRLMEDDVAEARQEVLNMIDCVGNENVYLEVQNVGIKGQVEWNAQLAKIAKDLKRPTVGTGDVHYLLPEDAEPHDAMLCVQMKTTLDNPTRMSLLPNRYYLRSPQEMRESLAGEPDSIATTLEIADRCNARIETGRTFELLPAFPVPEDFSHPDENRPPEKPTKRQVSDEAWQREWHAHLYLRELVLHGMHDLYGSPVPAEAQERMEFELQTVLYMGVTDYFLIIWDLIREANERGIPSGPGRGCFVGETDIWTPNGYQSIKDILPGTSILTHQGRLTTVRKKFQYDIDEELYTINAYHSRSPITVTGNHRVLVEKHQISSQDGHDVRSPATGDLQWVRAREIEAGDFVVAPIIDLEEENIQKWDMADFIDTSMKRKRTEVTVKKDVIVEKVTRQQPFEYSLRDISRRTGIPYNTVYRYYHHKNISGEDEEIIIAFLRQAGYSGQSWRQYHNENKYITREIPRYIEATEDLCRFIGLFAGDGNISTKKDENQRIRDYYTISEHISQHHSQELWEKVWGEKTKLKIIENNEENCRKLSGNSHVISNFIRHLFNEYTSTSQTKHLPSWYLQLSRKQRQAMLDGLWLSDGHNGPTTCSFVTSSDKLSFQVRSLLWSLSIANAVEETYNIDKRFIPPRSTRRFRITTTKNFQHPRSNTGAVSDEFIFMRVRSIEKTQQTKTTVYDLSTENEDSSFMTDSMMVHNSGAGSIVLYSLYATKLDPLEHGLLFERFLNPDRISMPDFDWDVSPVRRAEIMNYMRDKYGSENVAQIITFSRIGSKAGIRRAAQAMGHELLPLADKLAKAIPVKGTVAAPLSKAKTDSPEFGQLMRSSFEARKIVELAEWMEGMVQAESVHAAALILAPKPVDEIVPVQASKDGTPVSAFDMKDAEAVGLLKLDFLGLRNLDVIAECERLIKKYRNIEIESWRLPTNDKKTFEMMARGESVGVFQFESPGMQDALVTIGTDQFSDLVAIVALYRPGPMVNIPVYARRKKGTEMVTYPDPRVENILGETYGIVTYQEQSMLVAQAVADFTKGEADTLRKAIGKKNMDMMAELKPKFISGCKANGIKESVAQEMWMDNERAGDYSFNKCLSSETRVLLADGTPLRISEASSRGVTEIMSMWPDGVMRPHTISKIVPTGRKPLYEVRTQSGKMIRITQEHRLLTTEGYQPLSDMEVGTELITVPVWSEEEKKRRSDRMKEIAHRPERKEQDARAAVRMKAYQAARSLEDQQAHMKKMHELYPDLTVKGTAAMYDKIRWLRENDPAWVQRHTENSIASVRATYGTGPGFGHCSIASNGMWCASNNERAMCEWLIEQGVDFEMHKVLGNGRICDFYFAGIYWEMDGMDRTHQYFADKYGELPFVVVTPEDYQMIVAKHIEVEHAVNGDPIVSIEFWSEGPTYDIEMNSDGPKNFIANRIVSHNSHAAAYALISYVTAYLKANYPVEYMSALLTSVMSTQDKVPFYLYETRKMGLDVLAPDVNASFSEFEPDGGERSLRFGLTAIKGVGHAIVDNIAAEREANGSFKSMWDFVQRVEGVNRRELDALIKAGAFDSTGESRKGLLEVTEQVLKQAKSIQKKKAQGQDSLFDVMDSAEDAFASMEVMEAPRVAKEDFTEMEKFALEREVAGIYVSGHPLAHAQAAWEQVRHVGLGQLDEQHIGKTLTLAGIVTGKRVIYTKRDNKRMLVVTLEDMTGSREIVVFPKTLEQQDCERLVEEGCLVAIRAQIAEDDRGFQSQAASEEEENKKQIRLSLVMAFPFDPDKVEIPQSYEIKIEKAQLKSFAQIKAVLAKHPGSQPVTVTVVDNGTIVRQGVLGGVQVEPSEALTDALVDIIGGRAVVDG